MQVHYKNQYMFEKLYFVTFRGPADCEVYKDCKIDYEINCKFFCKNLIFAQDTLSNPDNLSCSNIILYLFFKKHFVIVNSKSSTYVKGGSDLLGFKESTSLYRIFVVIIWIWKAKYCWLLFVFSSVLKRNMIFFSVFSVA